MAAWIAQRLTAPVDPFDAGATEPLPETGSWPGAGWGHAGKRGRSTVSEWPVAEPQRHLAAFLDHDALPLSHKAARGFLTRLVRSTLRYDPAFRVDLEHHVETLDAR
jgi:DNA (cytosine-5)-methyltransferase 1